MNKPLIRCQCGHHVLGREVLRTQPYERASGAEVFYVKYRCRRCKKLGEAFVPRDEWDWSILETPRNEIGALERDRFAEANAISSGDVISFHTSLKKTQTVADLWRVETRRKDKRAKNNAKTKEGDASTDKSHNR